MKSRYLQKILSCLLVFTMMFTMLADGIILFAQEGVGEQPIAVEQTVEEAAHEHLEVLEERNEETLEEDKEEIQESEILNPVDKEELTFDYKVADEDASAVEREEGVVWAAEPAEMTGKGTKADPYVITAPAHLYEMHWDLDAYYVLGNDIVFTEEGFAEGGAFYNGGSGWVPVGASNAYFCGDFDGNNYSIYNLKINLNNSSSYLAGLFGYVKNANIRNLNMVDVDVRVNVSFDHSAYAAGIAAYVYGGAIQNCSVSGVIYSTVTNAQTSGYEAYAGGIAGFISEQGIIENCANSSNVNAQAEYNHYVAAGGIVGAMRSYAEVVNATNSGAVYANTKSKGDESGYAGGIVGEATKGVITSCHNSGEVRAESASTLYAAAGGIAGSPVYYTEIVRCGNAGDVSTYSDFNACSGGIAGVGYDMTIRACFNVGSVSAASPDEAEAAGIIAFLFDNGVVEDCYNASGVTAQTEEGPSCSGGIVGLGETITLARCYNIGPVFANATNGGRAYVDGVVGWIVNSTMTFANCYALEGTATTKIPFGDILSLDEMLLEESFVGFDFENVWTFEGREDYQYPELIGNPLKGTFVTEIHVSPAEDSLIVGESLQLSAAVMPENADNKSVFWSVTGGAECAAIDQNGLLTAKAQGTVTVRAAAMDGSSVYAETTIDVRWFNGSGTEEDPYIITIPAQLEGVREDLAAHYALGNDIVFTQADFAEGGAFYNEGEGWQPIGTYGTNKMFTGSFDGRGFTISGLEIHAPVLETYIGLFGYVNGGTVKNLGMVDCAIEATPVTGSYSVSVYMGAVVGHLNNGSVENCYNTGSVYTEHAASHMYCGGVVGYVNGGTVADCYNLGEITSSYSAGGIVGYLNGTITNCYNNGKVCAANASNSHNRSSGGIAGYVSSGTITRCYNSGEISAADGSRVYAGGIAGDFRSGTIANCYNKGATDSEEYAGGIAGFVCSEIENCYNVGELDAPHTGGIAGLLDIGSITNCYILAGCGENINVSVLSQGEMKQQTSFVGFDFDTVWTMQGNETWAFPELQGNGMIGDYATAIEVVAPADTVQRTKTMQLSVAFTPERVDNEKVEWSVVRGGEYASVDEDGLLTAIALGNVTVQAKTTDGSGITAQKTIAITPLLVETITIVGGRENILLGEERQFSAVVSPQDADNTEVLWYLQANDGDGLLDRTGLLLATEVGTVKVRAEADDGSGVYDEFELKIVSGTTDDPYVITSAAQLEVARSNLDACYVLGSNISIPVADGWAPIGTAETPFTGTFDGNGYAIDFGARTVSDADYMGLFGAVVGGTVKNLTVKGEVTLLMTDADDFTGGGIADFADSAHFENCISAVAIKTDSVKAINKNIGIGGVVGSAQNCVFDACRFKGSVAESTAYNRALCVYGRNCGLCRRRRYKV